MGKGVGWEGKRGGGCMENTPDNMIFACYLELHGITFHKACYRFFDMVRKENIRLLGPHGRRVFFFLSLFFFHYDWRRNKNGSQSVNDEMCISDRTARRRYVQTAHPGPYSAQKMTQKNLPLLLAIKTHTDTHLNIQ